MRQTRRQFVGTAIAALAASGVRAAPAPARQSLATFSRDPAKVEALRRGVAAMKALPASDHRSWFFQAAVHAYSDTLLAAETARDPKVATVDRYRYWDQCPHFGQCSADFLIWHRAYLHFFERNLRVAAGDPSLALPYWDYSQPEQRTFPSIYAAEFLDAAGTQPNPLFHPNREMSFARGLLELSAAIGEAPKTVAAATFFHQVGIPGFGGDDLDSTRTQIGLLEQRPHNDIHLAVGGVINSTNGAMAEITTAAFDPVFWVHHANIDRMWAAWASTPGKSWGPAPPADWFDEEPWVFLDSDGTERSLSRREAIGLVVDYDVSYAGQLEVPPAPVAAAVPEGGAPVGMPMAPMAPITRSARHGRSPAARELLVDATPLVVAPHRSGRRRFGGSRGNTGGGGAAKVASLAPPLAPPELAGGKARVLLELSDIRFGLVPSSGFAVYLDAEGEPPSADPVGLIDIFGATHHGPITTEMPDMPSMGQRFDVTAILRRSHGPFTLRVEPYDLLITRGGKAARSRADAVTIGAVRFVVIEA